MITLVDISNVPEEQRLAAHELAKRMQKFSHENLLNFTAAYEFLPSPLAEEGLIKFTTQAPDHKNSWKTFSKRSTFDLEQVVSIFRMMVAGVKHMHDSDFVARDLHPTRLHLEDGKIKWNLIGMPYNFKKLIRGPNYTGHLDMTAPELLTNPDSISKAADIWALGCCLYYFVTKRDPFFSEN